MQVGFKDELCCFQWLKVTKMKANHNFVASESQGIHAVSNGSKLLKWKQITTEKRFGKEAVSAVSNGSKLLKWKQITTPEIAIGEFAGCFQWLKVTKMKANHNCQMILDNMSDAVSNGSKLLKWKQITTKTRFYYSEERCFQWLKVTKMKANHNKNEILLFWGTLFPMAQSY